MFILNYLKHFLVFTLMFVSAGYAFAHEVNANLDDGDGVMTRNIVCIPITKDGRVLFSEKQAYAQLSEHLRNVGLDPQVVPYEQLVGGLANDSNYRKEKVICKDLVFLFFEGFSPFQEAFNADD